MVEGVVHIMCYVLSEGICSAASDAARRYSYPATEKRSIALPLQEVAMSAGEGILLVLLLPLLVFGGGGTLLLVQLLLETLLGDGE